MPIVSIADVYWCMVFLKNGLFFHPCLEQDFRFVYCVCRMKCHCSSRDNCTDTCRISNPETASEPRPFKSITVPNILDNLKYATKSNPSECLSPERIPFNGREFPSNPSTHQPVFKGKIFVTH